MDKRGNFVVIGFIIILFLLFIGLRTLGVDNITGYVTHNENFTVEDIYFMPVGVDEEETDLNDKFTFDAESLTFQKNNYVACLVNYTLKSRSPFPNLTIGFFSKNRNITDPDYVYYDVNNSDEDNVLCDEDQCLVYENITILRLGDWKCFANWSEDNEKSETLQMITDPPELIEAIPGIELYVNGSYIEGGPLDLSAYFEDPNERELTYGAIGQKHIEVTINSDNLVKFKNPSSWEGTEVIRFRAHNGITGTFSDNVSVKVGSGTTPDPQQAVACNPAWDCTWGTCTSGSQTCSYFDRNHCNSTLGKPNNIVRTCTSSSSASGATQTVRRVNVDLGTVGVSESKITGTTRSVLTVGIIILILGMIGGAVYFVFMKKPGNALFSGNNQQKVICKGQIVGKATNKVINTPELQKYIEAALKNGQVETKIKEDLIKGGWQKKDVDGAFNYIKLKQFVGDKLKAGFEKEKIVLSLKAKGWDTVLIDSIFKELGK